MARVTRMRVPTPKARSRTSGQTAGSRRNASWPSGRADSRVRGRRPARVARQGDFVEVERVAEGFLRGLVGSTAGALAEVGLGGRSPDWVGKAPGGRDRRQAPRTAPAGGLTL